MIGLALRNKLWSSERVRKDLIPITYHQYLDMCHNKNQYTLDQFLKVIGLLDLSDDLRVRGCDFLGLVGDRDSLMVCENAGVFNLLRVIDEALRFGSEEDIKNEVCATVIAFLMSKEVRDIKR